MIWARYDVILDQSERAYLYSHLSNYTNLYCLFWKNEYHIFELRKYELDRKKIIAVINTTYAVVKRKPEKNQACTGFALPYFYWY